MEKENANIFAVRAVFDDVTKVVRAARAVRDAGYSRWDVYAPFPIHGIDNAMGIRPTILPWIVLCCGILGCLTGLSLTIYTMSPPQHWALPSPWGPIPGYPLMISGKPFLSLTAFIPIVFELTILFSAFGAVFGMFLMNRLPMLYRPQFKDPGFRRATDDRIVIAIEAIDPQFDEEKITALLSSLGAEDVKTVNE